MHLRYNFHLFYRLQKRKTGDIKFNETNKVIDTLFRNSNNIFGCDSVWYDEKKGAFDFCGAAVLVTNFYANKINLTTNDLETYQYNSEI